MDERWEGSRCRVQTLSLAHPASPLTQSTCQLTIFSRGKSEMLILRGWKPPFIVDASEMANDFIYTCLQHTSDPRPSAWQLLKHPWITVSTPIHTTSPQSTPPHPNTHHLTPIHTTSPLHTHQQPSR
jgi:hypothetical protein